MLSAQAPRRYVAAILAGLSVVLFGLVLGAQNAKAATTSDDLVIVSNTPSPTHALAGDNVTFTIVAQNNGTVAEQPAIDLDRGTNNLNLVSESCPGASSVQGSANSGWTCYYPPLAPGATVTAMLTAQITGTPEPTADDIACVAPADQISAFFTYPPGGCQTAHVTIDPNLTGIGQIYADLEVDSITASVTHAKPGDVVTYTIVATNHGRDAGWMFVITAAVTSDLSFTAGPLGTPYALCGHLNGPAPTPTSYGVSADGGACEYGLVPPGDTVIDTYTAQVQAPGYATDTACAEAAAGGNAQQFSPTYPCKTAVVAVDDGTSTTPTPTPTAAPTPPAGPAGRATTPPTSTPSTSTSVVPGPPSETTSCPAYVGRPNWQYTILVYHKVTCGQSRALIHRADQVLRRTGVKMKVSSWSCRREPVRSPGAMWVEYCSQPRGSLVVWTERAAA